MEPEFWHSKWASGQIGFHEDRPHPLLQTYWPTLELAASARVFVPLCGKSVDLRWLRERGHELVGVELSELAVADFFKANELVPDIQPAADLQCYSAGGYTIFCGDYFSLDRKRLGSIDAVYDRAAYIALPPPMRARYSRHLSALSAEPCAQLLITVDYDQQQLKPPPFVVADDEIAAHYASHWTVERLATADAEVKGQPATETAYHLLRNNNDG